MSAAEHNIGIICIQEQGYYHSKQEIKFHGTGNGWTFVSVSAWKNFVNAIIEMLLSLHALKSLNSIEKIRLKMICATFNGNPCIIIISCCSLTNGSDGMDMITFYNKLSSLIRHIPKHNVLIIGGDMNI